MLRACAFLATSRPMLPIPTRPSVAPAISRGRLLAESAGDRQRQPRGDSTRCQLTSGRRGNAEGVAAEHATRPPATRQCKHQENAAQETGRPSGRGTPESTDRTNRHVFFLQPVWIGRRANIVDQRTLFMHDSCMATKTISLELDAYERLRKAKRSPSESFSSVVRRAIFPGTASTGEEALAIARARLRARRALLSEEAADRLDKAQRDPRLSGSHWDAP